MATRNLTVVFTDIKGFAVQVTSRTREEVLGVLDAHEQLLLPVVEHYGGRVVKTLGEAFLLVFDVPTQAVLAGVMMQQRLREYNETKPTDEQIHIGVAIHTGEAEVVDDSDVFGDAVNVANRIQSVTDAGEVYLTEATYLAMNKEEVPTSEVGTFRLRGMPEAVQVYKVVQDTSLPSFKSIVDQQAVPASPPRSRGAYSRGLLYSIEPQTVYGSHVQPGWLRWAVTGGAAAAVLIVFVISGLAIRTGLQRRTIQGLIEQKRTSEALALIAELQHDRPADARLQELAAKAADAEISRLLADWRMDDARKRLEDFDRDFPYLSNHRELHLRIELTDATWFSTQNNMKAAYEILTRLGNEYPEDRDVKFAQAFVSLEAMHGQRAATAVPLLQELLTDGKGLTPVQQKRLEEQFRVLLTKKAPDDFNDDLRSFIDTHMYASLKPFLQESLLLESDPTAHHLTDKFRDVVYLRDNAYIHLKRNGDIDPPTELQFMTLTLTEDETNTDFMREQVFPYFDGLGDEVPADLRASMPEKLEFARCLDTFSDSARACRDRLSRFYAEPLRAYLETLAGVEDERKRVNAYWILAQHGWTTPEMAHRYHMLNLKDYDPRYAAPHLVETLEYFTRVDRSQTKGTAEYIEEIVEGSQKQSELYQKNGYDHSLYDALHQKARVALAHVK